MDDEISIEGENDDPQHLVQAGMGIRRAGWDALPDWPQDPAGFVEWPRPGQTVTIALSERSSGGCWWRSWSGGPRRATASAALMMLPKLDACVASPSRCRAPWK